MVKINSENRNKKRRIDLARIKCVAGTASRKLGLCEDAELNIVFVSSQKIRAYNKRYSGKDSATDVIAFESTPILPGEKSRRKRLLGDIVISSDRAAVNARLYGVSFQEELLRYVVHGILHISGYRDKTTGEKEKMRLKEDEILRA